jgi:hypothetical protein
MKGKTREALDVVEHLLSLHSDLFINTPAMQIIKSQAQAFVIPP